MDNLGQDRLLRRYLYHPYHVHGFASGITQIFCIVYCRVAAWMVHVEIQVLREDPDVFWQFYSLTELPSPFAHLLLIPCPHFFL